MRTVILLPKNKRLKQLIKELGSHWTVLRKQDSVICFKNEPGVLISNKNHIRWVTLDQIEEIKNV